MKEFSPRSLVRENIRKMTPYRSARSEFLGEGLIYLDANENPFNSPFNRYPDPLQRELKKKIASVKGVDPGMIFLGNGSDEAIDLLMRAFCEPRLHNVLGIAPSYGMYRVAAATNGLEYRTALLNQDYTLNIGSIRREVDKNTRLIFLCSPNNPTANLLDGRLMLGLAAGFHGLLVVDEAYVDFAPGGSLSGKLGEYPNLVILQTFSKAWAGAGIRLGMALAHPEVIDIINKIKYPYNINALTIEKATEMTGMEARKTAWIDQIIRQRERLATFFQGHPAVERVYPSDANFLLVKFGNPLNLQAWLREHGIIVRDRSKEPLCEGCLRITVGSPEENDQLIKSLSEYEA